MSKLKTIIRIIITRIFGKDFSSPSLTKLLAGSTIISFDVFDTLIIRPGFMTPSDVFSLIHPEDPIFKSRRIEAERKARDKSSLEDITLDEIYKELYEDPRERQEAMALEISTELSVCRANRPALDIYNRYREEGKRIIIVSDMYLDRSTIERILINCGYDITDVNVYVSSEYGKTKRSGALFKEMMKAERVEGRDVLHIGDNLMSDFLRPRQCGIKSFLYRQA